VEVPVIESRIRQVLLGALGIGLLVAGVASGDGEETPGTTAAATTIPPVTASSEPQSTTEATTTPTSSTQPAEPEWVLLIDEAGELGIAVPGDWMAIVTDHAIWASPDVESWVLATRGEGPAPANGYAIRRLAEPESGSFEEIAEQLLDEMPVPSQCAFTRSDVERPGDGYFTYRVYECAPGGEYVNEVEIGLNPPWVTLESSRYLSDHDREEVLARIWESFRSY
jgi:hypothetical protein